MLEESSWSIFGGEMWKKSFGVRRFIIKLYCYTFYLSNKHKILTIKLDEFGQFQVAVPYYQEKAD